LTDGCVGYIEAGFNSIGQAIEVLPNASDEVIFLTVLSAGTLINDPRNLNEKIQDNSLGLTDLLALRILLAQEAE
jgi:hypothetical protein